MKYKLFLMKLSVKEILIILTLLISGSIYVVLIWNNTYKQENEKILQVAKSIEASLHLDHLKTFEGKPEDLLNPDYQKLKNTLLQITHINNNARFAYIYLQRNDKLYFIIDSEPVTSPDYSPPGQEFTEAQPIDKKPFEDGKALVTEPITDRWGTWVSAEVPIKDIETGQVIAVFGMDYNAASLKKRILFDILQSSLLVFFILFLTIVSRRSIHKNILLKKEITHREKAEKELIKKELTLSNLIGNLPGMVYRCALDENYTMEFISEPCIRITGYLPGDFLGNKVISFNELILPEYRQLIWEKWQKVMKEKSVFIEEYPIRTASGEIKWVWDRGSCIFDEIGEIQFMEGYIEDVTEKKKREADLIMAKEKAEESDRLKSAFLANLSHEIRTPMNGILGFAELIKEPDLSPENQQEFIGIIEVNLHRMLNIISDLIDISRIEAGETTLRIRKTNINKMLHELHLFFLPLGIDKNIQVDYHCDLSEDECTIETDSTKLNQILTYLIKNAIKFTTEGSIVFGYNHKETGIEFYVTDTGSGISPEHKELIFERFMQADQGLTRKYEGVGLGLAISKAYVEQLGGSLIVNSELGKGSTFFFELPYQAPIV
ncbi:MAG: PAS domain-containing protein [Prolixibacteraceae bacterium]|nr:PAS domain-containing protein [Prolixibacteraceae bacterium]